MFAATGPHTLDKDGKMFWPHPVSGGIEERVTRCFLGQLGRSSSHTLPLWYLRHMGDKIDTVANKFSSSFEIP